MDEFIGQQFGNYRLLRCLGRGGFADVYIGEHIHLGTYVAIKILHIRLMDQNRDAFFNEARALAQLNHPAIVRILDFGLRDTTPYLIMDYAPNGTLRQRFLKGTPLAPDTLFPFVGQIASALQYAHEHKLIHRDIKPENILLSSNNTLLLSDFGLVLSAQSSNLRSLQEVAGTAAYMAPEQLQGKPVPASDQYALGILVYEWLTGSSPFYGTFFEVASQHMFVEPPSMRAKVPAISPQIESVVLTALAKDPRQRFASVQIFAQALLNACQMKQWPSSTQGSLAQQQGTDNAIEHTYLKSHLAASEDAQRNTPRFPITPFPAMEDVKPLTPDMRVRPVSMPDTKVQDTRRVPQNLPVTPFPPVSEDAQTFISTPNFLSSAPIHMSSGSKDTPAYVNYGASSQPPFQPVPMPSRPTTKRRSKKVLFLVIVLIALVLVGSVAAFYQPARDWILVSTGHATSQSTYGVTPPVTCTNTFNDQFDGSTLDSGWLWNAGGNGTYELTGQRLMMTAPHNTDLRSWNMAAPRILRPLSGDFTVSVTTIFMPTRGYQGAGIVLWQDENNFIRLEHGYGRANGVTYEYSLNGKYVRVADTYVATNPAGLAPDVSNVELRMQRHNDVFSAWMRLSGGDWMPISTSVIPFSANLSVGLLVVNTNATVAPITATFSNFEMGC
jgi:serine/threonine protein kinase/regulation of enolase protein 1 (concanavalin A-like superfamily)